MNLELSDYFAAKAMQGLYAMLAACEAGKLEKKADDGWIQWNGDGDIIAYRGVQP